MLTAQSDSFKSLTPPAVEFSLMQSPTVKPHASVATPPADECRHVDCQAGVFVCYLCSPSDFKVCVHSKALDLNSYCYVR